MSKLYHIYILTNRTHGTIYTGVTGNLARRIWQHREGTGSAFTARYELKRLVYVEPYESISQAISREKTIKGWPRAWKIKQIEQDNPDWNDLYEVIL